MKKKILKKTLSLLLVLVLTVAVIPAMSMEADAAFAMMRQTDSQWNSVYVNGGSLTATGCGIFSFVNAVGYLTGAQLDVVEVARWAHSIGSFNVTYGGDGTYRTSFYPAANKKYGPTYNFSIDCSSDGTGYWSSVKSTLLKNHLLSGGVAVAHVYNHFIAIVGYDASSNKFHIWDCAPRDRRGTLTGNGDLWLSESYLTTQTYMTIDWFCLFSSTARKETWQEKAAYDTMVYRDRNPDIAHLSDDELKKHWLEHGIKEGRASSPVLDLGFYLGNNKDLQDAFGTDYEKIYNHFITHGYKEKRKSSALFDGQYYCDNNPEIYAEYGDEYMRHYAETGIKEGRRGSLTFDPDYYWVLKPEVWEAWPAHYELCAKHYAGYGVREGVEAYDNKLPVISDVKITNISTSGYTVTCTVTDNWGIEYVSFPTWTTHNNQDDLAENFLVTQRGTKNGDTYTFNVKTSDHNNEIGEYATHIYAMDKGENLVSLPLETIEVKDMSLETITLVSSSKYTLDGTLLSDVSKGTTANALLGQFENNGLKVADRNGSEVSGQVTIGTGMTVNLYAGGQLIDSLTVVISGDIDGTGIIDATDYMRVKSTFLGIFTLNVYEYKAADFDGSETIDATDYMKIKSEFVNSK